MAKRNKPQQTSYNAPSRRPPIVVVLGHVDHGKTTLLDTIRKTNVAAREHGGITQRIGAYQVEVNTKEGRKKITFIDTPGHEAFSKMRSRGANIADIAILVISATDGVMPQTKEAIQHIKSADIPMIVAINKVDLPGSDIPKVKLQLAEVNVLVEGYGGDVVTVPISAKVGTGIPEFLDMILLISELKGIKDDEGKELSAVVIETKRDRHRGILTSVIVKTGMLKRGDSIKAGGVVGKVRALKSSYGEMVDTAFPSDPVEILGFAEVMPVGSLVILASSKDAPDLQGDKGEEPQGEKQETEIKLLVKADSWGTLEAVRSLLPKSVEVVYSGVGDITESDILFAKTAGTLVVGFGVKVFPAAQKIAEFERVRIRTYTVIYELAEEIAEVLDALKAGKLEEVLGVGEVIAEFPFDRERIAGIRVKEGRLARGDGIKIVRKDAEIGRAKIKSIHQGKNDITKVETGQECGILIAPVLDFKIGDAIISYR